MRIKASALLVSQGITAENKERDLSDLPVALTGSRDRSPANCGCRAVTILGGFNSVSA